MAHALVTPTPQLSPLGVSPTFLRPLKCQPTHSTTITPTPKTSPRPPLSSERRTPPYYSHSAPPHFGVQALTFILITSSSRVGTRTFLLTSWKPARTQTHMHTQEHDNMFSSALPVWLHTSPWPTGYTTSPVMQSCAAVPLRCCILIS